MADLEQNLKYNLCNIITTSSYREIIGEISNYFQRFHHDLFALFIVDNITVFMEEF